MWEGMLPDVLLAEAAAGAGAALAGAALAGEAARAGWGAAVLLAGAGAAAGVPARAAGAPLRKMPLSFCTVPLATMALSTESSSCWLPPYLILGSLRSMLSRRSPARPE